MRPGSTRIESKGSIWWFDEQAREYLRLPRVEQPRERPEWSDERAGALQDAVWHPYEWFELTERALRISYIDLEGAQQVAHAPLR